MLVFEKVCNFTIEDCSEPLFIELFANSSVSKELAKFGTEEKKDYFFCSHCNSNVADEITTKICNKEADIVIFKIVYELSKKDEICPFKFRDNIYFSLDRFNFVLKALIIHQGSSWDVGHYFAYVNYNSKVGNQSYLKYKRLIDIKWYYCNDDNIQEVNFEEIRIFGYDQITMLVYEKLHS